MTSFSLAWKPTPAADRLAAVRGAGPAPADLPAPTAAAARDFCLRLIEATADLAAGLQAQRGLLRGALALTAGCSGRSDRRRSRRHPGDPGCQARRHRLHRGSLRPRRPSQPWAPAPSPSARTWAATAWNLSWPTRQRGVFLLCKTSNPGAADLQDLPG